MGEIFSSIWSVLTTENEVLTKILCAPTTFIEIWLGFLLFTSILNINYKKKQSIIIITLLSGISLVNEFFISEPINVLINYFAMFITIKFLLKQNIIKSILSTIIPTAIFALVTILILNPFLKFLNLTYEQNRAIPIYQLLYLITLYLIILIIVLIINIKKLRYNILEEITANNKRIILLNLITGFFILCIQNILTIYYLNIVPIIITFLNFATLFVYFFISFYSLNKTMKLQQTTEDLESAENYNTSLSYLYDNVRAFHHDFDNMLFIIGGFIDNNDIEGLKKYYKNLEKDGERVNELTLLNPKTINNAGIYNLLMSKYKKAHNSNVEIKLDFFFDFNRLKMPIYEFSRILGILLDNAIEAAAESEEKCVNIMFRESSANKTQIISIENSYHDKTIDTTTIFDKGKTSKENHTGMGLWEVKQILRRHNNAVLNTSNDDKNFKQTLEIYY